MWSNRYDRKWNDIFSVQSEVAQTVANELQAVITPEEKQLIDKVPTNNLTAYDFYQRGLNKYLNGKTDLAEDYYLKALKYDSTFAKVYVGLAQVYRRKYECSRKSCP